MSNSSLHKSISSHCDRYIYVALRSLRYV